MRAARPEPRNHHPGRDCRPWPVVSGWQATIDQFGANGVPPGHGHVYDETVVTAWSEIVGPPALPEEEIAAIEAKIGALED